MSAELDCTSSEEASSTGSGRSRKRAPRGGTCSSSAAAWASRPLVPFPPGSPRSFAKVASMLCSSAADSKTTWSPSRSPTSSPSVTWGIGSISPAAGSSSRSSRKTVWASSKPAPAGCDKQAIRIHTLRAQRRSWPPGLRSWSGANSVAIAVDLLIIPSDAADSESELDDAASEEEEAAACAAGCCAFFFGGRYTRCSKPLSSRTTVVVPGRKASAPLPPLAGS
mmetsp:Transcript_76580/g.175574  ORF Transcript_76580/g.175574 Transcript_76580/m.175574 type:complete len:224 (-) Transcript_76580:112-783(-)